MVVGDVREEHPMKMRIAAAGFVVLTLGMASRSDAQWVVSADSWYGAPVATVPAQWGQSGLTPYSYYAALPLPARGYVGYSNNDFPYYGSPYGSPSDPWTWPYMSTAYNAGLVR